MELDRGLDIKLIYNGQREGIRNLRLLCRGGGGGGGGSHWKITGVCSSIEGCWKKVIVFERTRA